MIEKNKHIIDLMKESFEIDISKYDKSFLNKSVQKIISEKRYTSEEEYCVFLEQNQKERENLLNSLNNNHSEFFRNSLTFATLERIVFPSLISKKKNSKRNELRIWSCAGSAGQEAYSIAILLEELKNSAAIKFDYRIFATDHTESFVYKAQKGKYSSDELNNLTLKRTKQWFTKHGEDYTAKTELKQHIDFSVFDLFNENLSSPPASIFGDFDLVICANILFYYKDKFRKIILNKINNCLAEGGYLITGEAERGILIENNFHEIFPQSAIFQA